MSPRSPPAPHSPPTLLSWGDGAAGPTLGERGTEGGSRQLASASDCPLSLT